METNEKNKKIPIDCTSFEGTETALSILIATISECFHIDEKTFDSLPARNVLVSLLNGKGACNIEIIGNVFDPEHFIVKIGDLMLFSDKENQLSITTKSKLYMHQKLLGHIRQETYNYSSFDFSNLGKTVIEDRRTVVGYVTRSYDYLWNLSALQTIFETTTSDHESSDIRSRDELVTLAFIMSVNSGLNMVRANSQDPTSNQDHENNKKILEESFLSVATKIVPNTIKTRILGYSSLNDFTETEFRNIVNEYTGKIKCDLFDNTYKDLVEKSQKPVSMVLE